MMKMLADKPAEEIIRKFCLGYKNRDLNALLALCSKNINMWGSGLDEYRVGLSEVEAQLKRDWQQSEKCEIEILSFVPTPKDALWSAAIAKAKITIAGEEHIFDHFRATVIIEKEGNTWKMTHMHASFPDYRNQEASSFPVA